MSSKALLKRAGLRITPSRIELLEYFLSQRQKASSIPDLLTFYAHKFDKVTLYRTINSFEEKGLIHKIIDESNSDKYALCGDDCKSDDHHHEHVHFYCLHCGNTECLNEHIELSIRLPKNYLKKHSNFLISGVCAQCNKG